MKSVSFARTALRIVALGIVLTGMIKLGSTRVLSSSRSATPSIVVCQQVADSNGQETHGKNEPKKPSGKRSS